MKWLSKSTKPLLPAVGSTSAIILSSVLLIVPCVLLAQKASTELVASAERLSADVLLEISLTDQKPEQRKAAAADLERKSFERVDVYSGPCGDGYQVIVADGSMEISSGFGCESIDRTWVRKLEPVSFEKATTTDEILSL